MSEVDLSEVDLSGIPELIRREIFHTALNYAIQKDGDSMREDAVNVAWAGVEAYLTTLKRPVAPLGTGMDSVEDMIRDVTRASEAFQSLIALLSSPGYLALSLDEKRNLLRQAQAERKNPKTSPY